jgi:hypothetical protein
MEYEGSLSYSEQPATEPYPEPDESRPKFPIYFPNTYFNIIFLFTPMSSKLFFNYIIDP